MPPVLGEEISSKDLAKRYIKGIDKGLLKVMSKMGISTYQSYCGAQIFDAVGLSTAFVRKYFTGTASLIEGVGLAEVAEEAFRRHAQAFGANPVFADARCRRRLCLSHPRRAACLDAGDGGRAAACGARQQRRAGFREFARLVDEEAASSKTLRGLFRIKDAAEMGRAPVNLDEVEPASAIVRRSTGAMSFGSISREAHTTLAIAMNRIGKSNTGEGGEEPDRFRPLANGDSMRSAIKQVASGRFGVTTEYLVNADQIQIKMAQGAKPGEAASSGHKVDATIARVRHSTPGSG